MQFADDVVAAYEPTAGTARTFYRDLDGDQEGLPDVVATAIRHAVNSPSPPMRLVVGADAHGWISDKLTEEMRDLARWQPSTASSD